jgi:hypothetical protein
MTLGPRGRDEQAGSAFHSREPSRPSAVPHISPETTNGLTWSRKLSKRRLRTRNVPIEGAATLPDYSETDVSFEAA